MGYVNSLFGNYGYIEVSSGQTIVGSFQAVKTRGGSNATINATQRDGSASTGLTLTPTETLTAPLTSVEVTGGAVLVYLNAPNYTIS